MRRGSGILNFRDLAGKTVVLTRGTVQEMSDWVEYLTRDGDSPMVRLRKANGRDAAWKVPYWGIGNEAWGCGGNLSAEAYVELARRYAEIRRDCRNPLFRTAAHVYHAFHEDEWRSQERSSALIGVIVAIVFLFRQPELDGIRAERPR